MWPTFGWHAGTKAGIVQESLEACGFEVRAQIVWAKNNFNFSHRGEARLRGGLP
jgi:hypothetical protein